MSWGAPQAKADPARPVAPSAKPATSPNVYPAIDAAQPMPRANTADATDYSASPGLVPPAGIANLRPSTGTQAAGIAPSGQGTPGIAISPDSPGVDPSAARSAADSGMGSAAGYATGNTDAQASPSGAAASHARIPTIRTTRIRADINRMNEGAFTALGFPADLSAQVIKYRRANGPFESVDDLRRVPGMDEELLISLRHKLAAQASG